MPNLFANRGDSLSAQVKNLEDELKSVIDILCRGNPGSTRRILAIKLRRVVTGDRLEESKNWVDARWFDGHEHRDVSETEPNRSDEVRSEVRRLEERISSAISRVDMLSYRVNKICEDMESVNGPLEEDLHPLEDEDLQQFQQVVAHDYDPGCSCRRCTEVRRNLAVRARRPNT